MKTCFVIMGFNTKRVPDTTIEINLNTVYYNLIKPVILEKKLNSLYGDKEFRADEVYSTEPIDKTFIKGIYHADILIADISTLNQNAIYELGLRHAMKPKSTIILCDNHTSKINFFDLHFIPQIRYDYEKICNIKDVENYKCKLSNIIDTCLSSNELYIDSPVFNLSMYRIITNDNFEISKTSMCSAKNLSIDKLFKEAQQLKNEEKFKDAVKLFKKIIDYGVSDEDTISGYILSFYKKEINTENLLRAQEELKKYVNIEVTTFSKILGISAAINLRLFELTKEKRYLFNAIEHYRRGMNFEDKNFYCGRNYCATLLKVYNIKDDIEELKEYYYLARHTAKIILGHIPNAKREFSDYDNVWFYSNQDELLFIAGITPTIIDRVSPITRRQATTLELGRKQLIADMKNIKNKIFNT